MLVEDQSLCYSKRGLAFYALRDYLSEEAVNRVLRDYIRDTAFQQPFALSFDLVKRFKKAAPDAQKYLIEDLFETITFYDSRAIEASFQKLSSRKYEVKFVSSNKKTRVDEQEQESETSMADYLDVGVFGKDYKLLYLKKNLVHHGQNSFLLEVNEEPFNVGIDPLNKLIDKIPEDNLCYAKPQEDPSP